MNQEGKFLKWNVAIAGDKKSASRWVIGDISVGKIERSKKSKINSYIDIGSLRSGRDVLSDVVASELNIIEKKLLDEGKKNRKNLIPLRYQLGLGDIPLLLLYCIDKDKGTNSSFREEIKSKQDLIGFSIIVAGEEVQSDYVKTVHVKRPE